MTSQLLRYAALTLLVATLAACDSEGITRPPQTTIRVVHVAPSTGEIDFRRVERVEANLRFGEGTSVSFDSGPYNFNIDVLPPGISFGIREVTLQRTLSSSEETVFILAEDANGLNPLILTRAPFDRTSANAEVIPVHAAASSGAVDIYFAPDGTDFRTTTPIGAGIAYGTIGTPTSRAEDDYRLTVTEAGNVSKILFRSGPFNLPAGNSAFAIITDGTNVSPFNVIMFSQLAAVITDVTAASVLRLINSTPDAPSRDIYVDDDFSAPLIPALPFGGVTDFQEFEPDTHDVIVTPTGNPSVEELRETIPLTRNRLYTMLLTGNTTDGIESTLALEDLTRIRNVAGIQLVNGAGSFDALSVYLTDPGVDISTVTATTILLPGEIDPRLNLQPGEYTLTIVDPVGQATVAGPTQLTLESAGIYGVMAVDAAGGSLVNLVLYDDFN